MNDLHQNRQAHPKERQCEECSKIGDYTIPLIKANDFPLLADTGAAAQL